MKKEYSSLFILKAIGALFVLMIHFHFPCSHYFEPFYKCGVPLFFIISGFFLYNPNIEKQKKRINKSVIKILKLIVFFNLIYYLLFLYINGESKIHNVNDFIRLIIYGSSISGHLWFLTSYLWTILLILFFKSLRIKDYVLYGLSGVCCIEGVLEQQYSFIGLEGFSILNYNLPLLGASLPMMVSGYYIKKHEQSIIHFVHHHCKLAFFIFIVCLTLPYAEHRLLSITHHYTGSFMFSTFLAVIAMFLYCVNKPTFGKGSYIETIGKGHSGNIYYWQFFPCPFVLLFVPYDIFSKFSLPIMIVVLLIWSYSMNYLSFNLKKCHLL